jgi:hypothetical protein
MPRLLGRGTAKYENRAERTLSFELYFRIKVSNFG